MNIIKTSENREKLSLPKGGGGPNLAGDSQFLSKFPPQRCSDDHFRMFVHEHVEKKKEMKPRHGGQV